MNRLSYRQVLPVVAAGMLLTPLALFAQAGGKGATLLRMKYKQGEVNKYQTNMAISAVPAGTPKGAGGGGQQLQQMSALQEFKTSKLLPNGSAEILVTTVNMQGGMGMGTTALPKPITLVMDSLGAVKSTKGSMGGNVPTMFSNMLGSNALGTQQIPLPAKAIKPGDSWTNNFSAPGMGAGSVKGRYVKTNVVGKHNTGLLHYVLNIPIKTMIDAKMQPTQNPAAAQLTMSGTIVMNIDNDIELSNGRLIRSTGSGTMTMSMVSKTQPKAGGASKTPTPSAMTFNTSLTLGTTLIEP